jgi:branched-chain amino acid transport system ATP-binding protein
MLEIRGLSKSFGAFQALKAVNLDLGDGEIVGLIGPNGAGKSTLVNVVAGAQRASAGQVSLNRRSITGLEPYKIARLGIGRTFQIVPNAAQTSVRDYAMIGALFGTADTAGDFAGARRVVDDVLATVGLAGKDAMLTEELNLVDRKRTELARVLAMRPSVILLDEVMAGLDSTDIDSVIAIIRDLRDRGIAVLLIEHVVDAVANVADRIAVLMLGEILTIGKPSAVLTDARVLEAYLGPRFRRAGSSAERAQ